MLEQYRISDFIEWSKEKKLILNPDFQRGSVWVTPAQVYLIDTILRGLPVPKIFLRFKIDKARQTSIREVVDGQQRLRAILEFAADKLKLTSRAKEFEGLTYSTLSDVQKARFLEYPLAVDQLLNASEDDVLEVFSRLNSYNVILNPAEKRHAQYQGKFKWQVRELAREFSNFWTDSNILSVRQRVRMEDDATISQVLMTLRNGVQDGGSEKIDKFYRDNDKTYQDQDSEISKVRSAIAYYSESLSDLLRETKLASSPQFLMILAAIMHRKFGIPRGDFDVEKFPIALAPIADSQVVRGNFASLVATLESGEGSDEALQFVGASKSSTQRFSSRNVRFRHFYNLLGDLGE